MPTKERINRLNTTVPGVNVNNDNIKATQNAYVASILVATFEATYPSLYDVFRTNSSACWPILLSCLVVPSANG
jgi:hypothetical protein